MGTPRYVSSFSRNDVLRILHLEESQLKTWEQASLMQNQPSYSFEELARLRFLAVSASRASTNTLTVVAGNTAAERSASAEPAVCATEIDSSKRVPGQLQLCFARPLAKVLNYPATTALALDASRADELFAEALELEQRNDCAGAEGLYREAMTLNPGNPGIYVNLGTLFFRSKRFADAEDLYRGSVRVDSNYVIGWYNLGNVADELGRYDDAIEAYSKALAIDPAHADSHYNLALAFERTGDSRSAIRHWQAYLRLDSSGSWAEHARGQLRKLLSQEKLAIVARGSGSGRPALSSPTTRPQVVAAGCESADIA
jgi:tetratricopeptide (TPR) repeat protein